MIRERNIILKRAVPEVQKFCSEMGIRFQLIDLHCGMGPNDQTGKNRDIRKWQILQSQLHSIGAHFVVTCLYFYSKIRCIKKVSQLKNGVIERRTVP